MGLISKLGQWLDYFWAEKALRSDTDALDLRLDQFNSALADLSNRILNQTDALPKLREDNLKLRDELTAIKALLHVGGMKQSNPVRPPTQKFDGSEPWKR